MPAITEIIDASTNWVAPAGVFEVLAECEGPGGKGGGGVLFLPFGISGGGGGGGGAYAAETVPVVPGQSYTATIGAAGSSDTWFGSLTTVLAKRGSSANLNAAGQGGQAAECVGSIRTSGSNGQNGAFGGVAGSGGAGAAPLGAAGGAGNGSGTGAAGSTPGGGGGGGQVAGIGSNASGGAGGPGRIRLTYTPVVLGPYCISAKQGFIAGAQAGQGGCCDCN